MKPNLYPPRVNSPDPHMMPDKMQADLYDQGLLDDPDCFNAPNGVKRNADKVRWHVDMHDEPAF